MRDTPDPLVSQDPLARIAAEPWRYDFFHALRWLESRHLDKPRFGSARRPADEPVRLKSQLPKTAPMMPTMILRSIPC